MGSWARWGIKVVSTHVSDTLHGTTLGALSPIYVTNTTFHTRNVSLFIISCLSNRTVLYCAVPGHLTVVSILLDQNKHIHTNSKIIYRWPFLQVYILFLYCLWGFRERNAPWWRCIRCFGIRRRRRRRRCRCSWYGTGRVGVARTAAVLAVVAPVKKSTRSLKIWYGWNSMGELQMGKK